MTTMSAMARWAPDARVRLRQAAMDAFSAHGFDAVTVADIAASAGVTERTFYRYFADKREVMFDPEHELERLMVQAVADAPTEASPREMIRCALRAAAEFFPNERRDHARRRTRIIASDAGLQEREAHKMRIIAGGIGTALRARGIPDSAASIAAELCTLTFSMSFARWIEEGESRALLEVGDDILTTASGILSD